MVKASSHLKLTTMIRLLCGGLLLIFLSQVVFAQDDAKNARRQAEEMGNAYASEDLERFADLTNPKLLELAGGRDKMIAFLRGEIANMRKEGVTTISQSADPPSQMLQVGNELFAVVPVVLKMKVTGGTGIQPSSLIGVSTDSGEHWTFIDAGNGDPRMLKTIFPTAADKLQFPAGRKPPEFFPDAEPPKKP